VGQARSQEELIERSDCLVVLSPDNPERHEQLARLALMSGKPLYVDKTFAPDRAAAERMFDLAANHGTPMYSTSALRYSEELGWLKENQVAQQKVEFVSARGPGEFTNYSIHQIEMIVAAMGTGAKRACSIGTASAPAVVYEYEDGRRSIVNHLSWSGFSLALQASNGMGADLEITSNFWGGFVDALLDFFQTGMPKVQRAETCEVIAMVEAGLEALRKPGWVNVARG
jgi:hypothetical protein